MFGLGVGWGESWSLAGLGVGNVVIKVGIEWRRVRGVEVHGLGWAGMDEGKEWTWRESCGDDIVCFCWLLV
jgi:hypothetical protein